MIIHGEIVWNGSRVLAALLWRLVYGRGPMTVVEMDE